MCYIVIRSVARVLPRVRSNILDGKMFFFSPFNSPIFHQNFALGYFFLTFSTKSSYKKHDLFVLFCIFE